MISNEQEERWHYLVMMLLPVMIIIKELANKFEVKFECLG